MGGCCLTTYIYTEKLNNLGLIIFTLLSLEPSQMSSSEGIFLSSNKTFFPGEKEETIFSYKFCQ